MGKVIISRETINQKINDLNKELSSSHSDLNNISINSKIETLNWILNNFYDPNIETITFKELRVKYIANSRDNHV